MSHSSVRAAQETGFFGYPDDDEACIQHGNARDTCRACIEAFKREEAEYRAFRVANPLMGDRPGDAEAADDLPY